MPSHFFQFAKRLKVDGLRKWTVQSKKTVPSKQMNLDVLNKGRWSKWLKLDGSKDINCPLSPFWTVHFGPDSGARPKLDGHVSSWTVQKAKSGRSAEVPIKLSLPSLFIKFSMLHEISGMQSLKKCTK